MQAFEHPFTECVDCRFFKPGRMARECKKCGSGENFEERIEELNPELDTQLHARTSKRFNHDDE